MIFTVLLNRFISFFKNLKNLKMDSFIFFGLSPKVFELHRCIIPHFKAHDQSFDILNSTLALRLKALELQSKKCV